MGVERLLEFGILNIDKPSGPTSFQVDEFVKKSLGLRKTSHFGTLDPNTSGVLPIALNRACKLLGWFIKKRKTYVGIMKIHKKIPEEKLKEEMSQFVGKIIQLPPVKSRVKREEREREVYYWKILEFDGKDVLFEVECEAGTYVRKLISNLGEKIGGAHMAELRRIKAGIFSEQDKNFVNLYEFEKAVQDYKKGDERKLQEMLIPAGEAIKKVLPVIHVGKKSIKQLFTGKPLFKQDLMEGNLLKLGEENFAVFCNERFIGVYRKVEEGDIVARSEFVFN